MTVGFSTGTLFDISGTNVQEVKVNDCKLTRYANTSSGQPYYALRIDAPNSRLLFSGNDIAAASTGNTGIQINAIETANIVGNAFTFLQVPIDLETTGGMISISGNCSTGTSGSSAMIGTATSNVQDCGNAWDKRPLNWNPVYPSYMSTALNGLTFKADGGFGVNVNAFGPNPNVTLNLVSSGSGSVSMLTRGYAPQFVVLDNSNTTTLYAQGGTASAPALINAGGSSTTGLALQNTGGGPILLGAAGVSGSSVVHMGASADQSYTAPAGVGGGTYQVPNNTSDVQLTTAPGTIASLAVTLPTQPLDGQVIDLSSVAAISVLSIQSGNSAIVFGAPSALPANGSIRFKYLGGAINAWFHRIYN